MPGIVSKEEPLEVAIVGGGIIGLALAAGLVYRNVRVKVYEKTSSFRPIGAGIGFTEALALLHPGALEAERKVATANGDPNDPNDWLKYVDAYNHEGDESDEEPLRFQLYTGYRGFEGCVRAHFLEELLKLIPKDVIVFSKNIDTVVDQGDNKKTILRFKDGTTAEADVVVGCDGIKSRIRKLMLGNHPAAEPSYNHQYAVRCALPMDMAAAALGEYKAHNRHMHMGQNSYIGSVPIGLGKMINVVAFVLDPGEWPDKDSLTAPADADTIIKAFQHHRAPISRLIQKVVEYTGDTGLVKWGIFDSVDNPSPTFSKGRVAIAGDAAHAMSPHHGAGAGTGIEDCLVLADLLADVNKGVGVDAGLRAGRGAAIRAALQAYTNIRIERAHFICSSSRVVGQLLEWRYPPTMTDWDKCLAELRWRSHKIWHYDEGQMVKDAQAEYKKLLEAGQ
ncbi:hypothetical protein M406DRAFT_35453 [Cryphonectria parasitica EP155]|uniref:FAD-binding domain-containing protein n=1 Tax=Cryphonectria parasitica (strain ATCC 38755 / EP155) TaxID=660469 RepID=A0A9P5CTZ5_CRYP1|nr:uncharacterized protein M406DRAFT_35453 [Cryphonectria parasitica EP155]KAF3771154.1 hypothetical protein M406DRAFT_35453 [Cryphonectria parasitica EP155]